jgi:peptidoglycan-N-acetylglucosamine deacetylase
MIFAVIIISAILLWSIIYPVTDFYTRFLAPDVIKKGTLPGKKICLTFDDGPDPRYTPALLKILQEAGIPAVFFLVGWKSETHPDLVRKIREAGHEIGLHTYYHRHSYLMFIDKSVTTIRKGSRILTKITNRSPFFFRPPWGALNLFQYVYARKLGLKIVLWTANARDWEARTQPNQIVDRLSGKVGPGSIIVLHDSGGDPGTPQNTLKALPDIIAYFKSNGYQFVSLQAINGETSTGGSNL